MVLLNNSEEEKQEPQRKSRLIFVSYLYSNYLILFKLSVETKNRPKNEINQQNITHIKC
jgi:hypothetical protein